MRGFEVVMKTNGKIPGTKPDTASAIPIPTPRDLPQMVQFVCFLVEFLVEFFSHREEDLKWEMRSGLEDLGRIQRKSNERRSSEQRHQGNNSTETRETRETKEKRVKSRTFKLTGDPFPRPWGTRHGYRYKIRTVRTVTGYFDISHFTFHNSANPSWLFSYWYIYLGYRT